MGELSPWHWAIVIGIAVLLFGAKRLPDAARSLGRSARILRAELHAGAADKAATDSPATDAATTEPVAVSAPAAATVITEPAPVRVEAAAAEPAS
jgi:sec-independent protein translocase protein TatA